MSDSDSTDSEAPVTTGSTGMHHLLQIELRKTQNELAEVVAEVVEADKLIAEQQETIELLQQRVLGSVDASAVLPSSTWGGRVSTHFGSTVGAHPVSVLPHSPLSSC
jgi:hypothetical protein